MRVVGYVRESSDPSDARPAFNQHEELRRHAAEHGDRLVAVCQDLRSPGMPPSRDGYVSLLGVVAAGAVDAVLVPGVTTLSSDAIVQEIMLWDLRSRGVRVVSTDPADDRLLDPEAPPEPSRMVIRDVLQRVGEHAAVLTSANLTPSGSLLDGDVFVQIIEADVRERATTSGEG